MPIPNDSLINCPKEAALAACAYVREHILTGSSWIAHNDYEPEKQHSVRSSVRTLKYALWKNEQTFFSLESNKDVRTFYKTASLCKKFKIGNCIEMSFLALEYMLNHASPEINAEVFYISGGNHAFLVVGRKRGSTPTDPTTWGEKCYICDPYANEVFLASQYQERLNNFFFDDDQMCHLEDFKPDKHGFEIYYTFTSDYIRSFQTKAHAQQLITLFKEKGARIQTALTPLENTLTELLEEKDDEYDEQKEGKRTVVLNLFTKLQDAKAKIKNIFDKDYPYEEDSQNAYSMLLTELNESVKEALDYYFRAVQLSKEEQSILAAYRKESFIKTKLHRLFQWPPATVNAINNAMAQTKNELEEALAFRPQGS